MYILNPDRVRQQITIPLTPSHPFPSTLPSPYPKQPHPLTLSQRDTNPVPTTKTLPYLTSRMLAYLPPQTATVVWRRLSSATHLSTYVGLSLGTYFTQ